jgi:hypothetical protein
MTASAGAKSSTISSTTLGNVGFSSLVGLQISPRTTTLSKQMLQLGRLASSDDP